MKEIILYIDTSDNTKTIAGLFINGKKQIIEASLTLASQNLLPLIEKLLIENNLQFKDLTEIKVHTGPGSYTGLRVGISIANTLGFLLGKPINSKNRCEIVKPNY